MTKMSLEYNGSLRTKLVHNKSGTIIYTDAPTDNHGLGESFSPTDLVASALAACMITVLGIQNIPRKLGILKMSAEVKKNMESNPRRISEIQVILEINMKPNSSVEKKKLIQEIAENCPVAKSLDAELNQLVRINFT